MAGESWLRGVETACIGCGLDPAGALPASTNVNAPWALHGRWRRQTPFGVVSTGFMGVRNYALPLSTVVPLGGGLDAGALRSLGANQVLPVSQWSVTAGIEKTLVKRANGASVGVAADVLVPVSKDTAGVEDPRVDVLGSTTTRFGIVVRW
jgi:hypothetical protein